MILRYSRPEMVGIWETEARLRRMLEVELAWTEAIAHLKRLPRAEIGVFRSLLRAGGLEGRVLKKEEESGHDVVALLQVVSDALRRKAPRIAQYLHYGLTSSDVLDTALALQLRDAAGLLIADWEALLAAIRTLSRRHARTWMAGRTHGVHAEPTTFGLKLAGWHAEGRRNLLRLRRAREAVSFGKLSGAVGSYAHFPPRLETAVLRRLGLAPEPVSTQVVPRDRHAEFFAALALSAGAIERFATEIRHLQRTEVLEAEEPFGKGQKGSSAMPHKRNPILCENLCGLARLIRGHAVPMLEDIALWHERDISHSSVERVALPDAAILLDFMLQRFTRVVAGLQVYPAAMRRNLDASCGLVFSQRVLLNLIDRGLSRMDAYDIVQRGAMETWRTREPFQEVLWKDPAIRARFTRKGLSRCFDLAPYGGAVRQVLRREGIL
ncbi:MAG: adenylosuccinate lyase [Elusimicrobia bacterium GWA2_69_24]|nr:MAG: adenylosuccinate lyase [Elusimicrobia bacterium GWA2_69_24]